MRHEVPGVPRSNPAYRAILRLIRRDGDPSTTQDLSRLDSSYRTSFPIPTMPGRQARDFRMIPKKWPQLRSISHFPSIGEAEKDRWP